jgi:UDP-N-acetylmuramyl pentapeptide synthase
MSENSYTIQHIAELLNVKSFQVKQETRINTLLIDSRSVTSPDTSLFFALMAQRDGHDFIEDAYQAGVRSFVISKPEFYYCPRCPQSFTAAGLHTQERV